MVNELILNETTEELKDSTDFSYLDELKSPQSREILKNIDQYYFLVGRYTNSEDQESIILTAKSDSPQLNDYVTLISQFLPDGWTDPIEPLGFVDPNRNGRFVTPKDVFPGIGIDFFKLRELLIQFEDPTIHIAFATNILRAITSIDPKVNALSNDAFFNKEQLAKIALYIYGPITEVYGLTDLQIQLQDAAFKVLDPVSYALAEKAWNENYGRRMTLPEVKSILSNIQDSFERWAGVPKEYIKVRGREKSLYSYFQKGMGEASVEDSLALTCIFDLDKLNPYFREKLNFTVKPSTEPKFFKRLINKVSNIPADEMLRYTFKASGTLELKITDTYTNPQDGDTRYKVIKARAILSKSFYPNGVNNERYTSFSLATSLNDQFTQISHLFYKRFVRESAGAAAPHFGGVHSSEFNALGDWALTQLEKAKGNENADYQLSGTHKIINKFKESIKPSNGELRPLIPLVTAKGNNLLFTNIEGRSLPTQIMNFINRIHNLDRLISGTNTAIYVGISRREGDKIVQYQSQIQKTDVEYTIAPINGGRFSGITDLKPFDRITILQRNPNFKLEHDPLVNPFTEYISSNSLIKLISTNTVQEDVEILSSRVLASLNIRADREPKKSLHMQVMIGFWQSQLKELNQMYEKWGQDERYTTSFKKFKTDIESFFYSAEKILRKEAYYDSVDGEKNPLYSEKFLSYLKFNYPGIYTLYVKPLEEL